MMDSITEINLNNIVSYFREGCKSASFLGLELEHFAVDGQGRLLPYSGEKGIEALLYELSNKYQEKFYSQGHLIALRREDAVISIEPAGQLEISISPQTDAERILQIYESFRREADSALAAWGCKLVEAGYLPKGMAANQELIPKKRYEYMNDYFARIGKYGCCMMRGTAATQVSVDYCDEEDFVRKYEAAYKLTPLLAWITGNTPVFEDKPNHRELIRMKIWREVDKDRTNVYAYLKGSKLSFRSYAEFVYNTPLIVGKLEGRELPTAKTAKELYADRIMNAEEIENTLSMVFPCVRLKRVLELRGADSLPIEEALGYVVLVKALFMSPDVTLDWLKGIGLTTVEAADALADRLLEQGSTTTIHGKSMTEVTEGLFGLAETALEDKERKYLSSLQKRVQGRAGRNEV